VLSYVVTHPEVVVDPATPVTAWGLSERGRERAERLVALDWVPGLERVVASAERKAQETAALVAAACCRSWTTEPALGENDRSATGFLPPEEFERTADAFFASPEASVRGWETAAAAQARIVAAVRSLAAAQPVPTAYVTHGAVGTLLWCHLSGVPVSRRHDQPGQGSWYAFDPDAWRAVQPWQRIG
jgi:broad specificity phosphatase PhoE